MGRALDMSEAPLPGVSVTMLSDRRGTPTQTIADHDGRYRFDDVPAGTYRIDFKLPGFDIARVNHVEVQPGATATAHGWLRVGSLCECIMAGHGAPVVSLSEPPAPAPLEGQVVDDAGRPLPYATLDLVTVQGRETAYTDHEGRFRVRAPVGTWSITASDSGFEAVTREVSGTTSGPLVFRLPNAGTQGVANTERLNRRTCYCHAVSFVHEQR